MQAAITNTSAYARGELRFTWLELPATEDELSSALDQIGGKEWFVSDYDADNVDAYGVLGEYPALAQMNAVAEVDELNGYDELISYDLENNLRTSVSEDVVSADELDELVKHEAEQGAARVFFFLRALDGLNVREDDFFRINGYGNVEPLSPSDYCTYADEVAQAAALSA